MLLFKVGYFRHVSILPDLVVLMIDCCLILRSGNFDIYQIHPTLIHISLLMKSGIFDIYQIYPTLKIIMKSGIFVIYRYHPTMDLTLLIAW